MDLGLDKKIIIETGKKISEIPNNFSIHKTLDNHLFSINKYIVTSNKL